jgi:hypothetical protein
MAKEKEFYVCRNSKGAKVTFRSKRALQIGQSLGFVLVNKPVELKKPVNPPVELIKNIPDLIKKPIEIIKPEPLIMVEPEKPEVTITKAEDLQSDKPIKKTVKKSEEVVKKPRKKKTE